MNHSNGPPAGQPVSACEPGVSTVPSNDSAEMCDGAYLFVSPLNPRESHSERNSNRRLPWQILSVFAAYALAILVAALMVRSERVNRIQPTRESAEVAARASITPTVSWQTSVIPVGAVATSSKLGPRASPTELPAPELAATRERRETALPKSHEREAARAPALRSAGAVSPSGSAPPAARSHINPWQLPPAEARATRTLWRPWRPTRAHVISAMQRVTRAVYACFPGGFGSAEVKFTVLGKTGRVTTTHVTGQRGPVSTCIGRAVQSARLPAFQAEQVTISYPFRRLGGGWK